MKRIGILGLVIIMLTMSGCGSNASKGISLLEDGKYDEAIGKFQEDIDAGKNLDDANRGMALAYYELGSYMEAVYYFEEALANDTEETASLYHLMGTCCFQYEDYENTIAYFDKALAMEDCTEDMKKEMMFNKIAACEKLGDWEAAETAVLEYLESYPDDERAIKEAEFLETR